MCPSATVRAAAHKSAHLCARLVLAPRSHTRAAREPRARLSRLFLRPSVPPFARSPVRSSVLPSVHPSGGRPSRGPAGWMPAIVCTGPAAALAAIAAFARSRVVGFGRRRGRRRRSRRAPLLARSLAAGAAADVVVAFAFAAAAAVCVCVSAPLPPPLLQNNGPQRLEWEARCAAMPMQARQRASERASERKRVCCLCASLRSLACVSASVSVCVCARLCVCVRACAPVCLFGRVLCH